MEGTIEPLVVEGLWCVEAESLPTDQRNRGELVFLTDSIEFRGTDGTLRMTPIRGFDSGSIPGPGGEGAVTIIDHGVDGNRAYVGSDKFDLDKVRAIFTALHERNYVPGAALASSLRPFRETFMEREFLAVKQLDSLVEASIRLQDTCIGCGAPALPRMMAPWHLVVEVEKALQQMKETQSGWLSPRVPLCLPCHGFGLFSLFNVSVEWWPNLGMRLFLKFPSVIAYEPFRLANELPKESFLARPSGGAHVSKNMPEAKAEAVLKPGLDLWGEMDERFGLHRYLRIKARVRQLSAQKGVVRRRSVLSSDEIRSGLADLMETEQVSEDDLWEMETLMNESIPALLELG